MITPNIPEAEVLSGMEIHSADDMRAAAKKLSLLGCQAVLVKGGHRVEDAMDILYDGSDFHVYKGERIETDNTHGTGCTLSSALAVMLARGLSIADAVTGAKKYISGAIKRGAADSVGHGNGPVHHFWFYGDKWGDME